MTSHPHEETRLSPPIRLAYSTYALQSEDPFAVVPRIRDIGYAALELNVGDDWPTAPQRFDGDARQALRDLYAQVGFPSPVLMNLINLCAVDEDRAAKEASLAATCQMAADLHLGDDSRRVVTTTLGHQGGATWEASRERVAEALRPYARIAADHDVVLAIEPHAGQEMDTPDKAVWLVEQLDDPAVRLNFDHSHFQVLGIDLAYAAQRCAEWSVHIHIKDGRLEEGQVRYRLPGEGTLDMAAFFRTVAQHGPHVPVTAEVTGQIWKREDYDPWATAQRCYDLMRAGLDKAGV
jgi:sugar phosphate isomerase/epimerase